MSITLACICSAYMNINIHRKLLMNILCVYNIILDANLNIPIIYMYIYIYDRYGIKQLRTCQWIMNSSVFQIMNSEDKKERKIEDEEEDTEKGEDYSTNDIAAFLGGTVSLEAPPSKEKETRKTSKNKELDSSRDVPSEPVVKVYICIYIYIYTFIYHIYML